MAERYVKLQKDLYFDTKDRVIVKSMGDRFVFVRHDRRRKSINIPDEKRAQEKIKKGMKQIGSNLYFDPNTKQIYRQIGDKLVLYSRDRRKEKRPVTTERRKE
jgi:hypothetical protein